MTIDRRPSEQEQEGGQAVERLLPHSSFAASCHPTRHISRSIPFDIVTNDKTDIIKGGSPHSHEDTSAYKMAGTLDQDIDPRKLTPSCSRCRVKKLRCDTQQPCSNCITKGLENECRKDQRIPRGRKRLR